jgi:putative transposase
MKLAWMAKAIIGITLFRKLWRTIRYEEVYLKNYESGEIALKDLSWYTDFYNKRGLHQSRG